MSSARQIEANRLNALKSTGPRTAAGKAVSSMNALETGIDAASLFIPGECLATLFALSKEYVDHYQPATPAERTLVDSLLRQEWLLRRFTLIESHLWEKTNGRAFSYRPVGQTIRLRPCLPATRQDPLPPPAPVGFHRAIIPDNPPRAGALAGRTPSRNRT